MFLQAVDEAMKASLDSEHSSEKEEEGKSVKAVTLSADDVITSEDAVDGEATTSFMFQFGAVCLER